MRLCNIELGTLMPGRDIRTDRAPSSVPAIKLAACPRALICSVCADEQTNRRAERQTNNETISTMHKMNKVEGAGERPTWIRKSGGWATEA